MNDLSCLLTHDVNTFLIGDFNDHHSSWNCNYSNTYGTRIYIFLQNSTGDTVFPASPTRYSTYSSSTIDFGHFNRFNYVKKHAINPGTEFITQPNRTQNSNQNSTHSYVKLLTKLTGLSSKTSLIKFSPSTLKSAALMTL